MKILVTGHLGYIGSVMCNLLREQGHYVIGIDINPGQDRVPVGLSLGPQMVGHPTVAATAAGIGVDCIFHLAASTSVEESVSHPGLYYWNNTGETAAFLRALQDKGWKGKFIFSSTAAVYGIQGDGAKESDWVLGPCNPYGYSKLMAEQVVKDVCQVAGIDAVIFRYFNVAGASESGGDHLTGTRLFSKLCEAIYDKKQFTINGNEYETRDGTCIRDYVHVLDICRAHLTAVDYLETHKGVHLFNLGASEGFTNKEIVDAFISHTGQPLEWQYGAPRPGDPPVIVADNGRFIEATGFEYTHTNLDEMVKSAWAWYQKCRAQ